MTEATGSTETLAVFYHTTLVSLQKARSQYVSVSVHKYKVVSLGRHHCIIFCNTLVLMCRFFFVCLSVKSTRIQYCTPQLTVLLKCKVSFRKAPLLKCFVYNTCICLRRESSCMTNDSKLYVVIL
jgi:hypothetical protein